MHAADPKPKEIAGQQEIDGLSTPVGPKDEPPCRAGDDPVPTPHRTLLWIDFLVPLKPGSYSKRLERCRYRSRALGTLVRPRRFTDMQASSIGVHFSPSIRLPCRQ
jgi:hypothetical protein